ncbi:MAG: type II toxin-antitoxin system Phd/YefM family antitoxin [Candidatus Desulfatibia sp.]|uniref:type II toxin-antitoxin system Phd/YefM family antitoxin n=1 Tax=Candidatus Desulfatibia sp. TaxID=3101189 RepID=UPI002F2D57CF
MEKYITATQAVRDFSELLNTIKFKGDHYIIQRNGKPIASMQPIKSAKNLKTLEELKLLIKQLPRLDDELEVFAADIKEIWKNQPPLPEDSAWE